MMPGFVRVRWMHSCLTVRPRRPDHDAALVLSYEELPPTERASWDASPRGVALICVPVWRRWTFRLRVLGG